MHATAQALLNQHIASLQALADCINLCPDNHWETPIVKYPFWEVAYHTLCMLDYNLSPSAEAFTTRPDLHPRGMDELNEEHPSRRFERAELLHYIDICRQKATATLTAETEAVLHAPCAFPRRPFSRLELHIHSIRHTQHHTGQLGALVRKAGCAPAWRFSGWVQ
jgi:hypothetical protein